MKQTTDNADNYLKQQLLAQLHSLVKDEAEALEEYAKLLECDNPFLTGTDINTIKAITANEKDHENKLNEIIKKIDGVNADSNIEELAAQGFADALNAGRKKEKSKL